MSALHFGWAPLRACRSLLGTAGLAIAMIALGHDRHDGDDGDYAHYPPTASGRHDVSVLHAADPLSWLVKSICVDAVDRPIKADPYEGCPVDSRIRKIELGDPLPYHNIDQIYNQQSDSFPLLDADGHPLYLHTFDYAPFNEFNLDDGFDVYAVRNGWVSISNTGGFNGTFWGIPQTQFGGRSALQELGCYLGSEWSVIPSSAFMGGGWLSFPTSGFLDGGALKHTVGGSAWEQSGQEFPGACAPKFAGYDPDNLTTWHLHRDSPFGGIGHNPVKRMDTLVSVHGHTLTDDWLNTKGPHLTDGAHLEVYYFTREYGLTKWEDWVPIQQVSAFIQAGSIPSILAAKTPNCVEPDIVTYQGREFVVADCRDWSNVTFPASLTIPEFPLPNPNLLHYWHFTLGGIDANSGLGQWHRFGSSPAGNLINRSVRISKAESDTGSSKLVGVNYLAVNCGAGSDGQCGQPGTQAIYQDLPAIPAGTYLIGVNARTEGGKGTLAVAIQQIDAYGFVLWGDVVTGSVSEDNVPYQLPEPLRTVHAQSVYLSSAFIHKTVSVPFEQAAVTTRFLMLPVTPQTFDIVAAYLNPFPTAREAHHHHE